MHSLKPCCLCSRYLRLTLLFPSALSSCLMGTEKHGIQRKGQRTRKAAVNLLYTIASFSLNPYSAISSRVSWTDHINSSLKTFPKVLCLLWHFSSSDDTVLTKKGLSLMQQPKTGSLCAFIPWGPEQSFNFSSFLATLIVFFLLGEGERRARAGSDQLK